MSIALLGLVFTLFGCEKGRGAEPESAGFTLLQSDRTGLDFTNSPQLSEELNVFNYMYFYNGGGLAAGDFNNDGLPDLYFTANRDRNALYINQGDLRFREVTDIAGLAGQPGWTTGASVVDINQDGRLDIYVSQVSGYAGLTGHNQLYINEGVDEAGIPLFSESAQMYGLDQQGFGTQAVFFDYDGDGDLDCFQLNHSVHQNGTFGPRASFADEDRHPLAGDRLLRNDGLPDGKGNGGFTDVSAEAGIIGTALGYGLGVSVGDVNNDGWPDLYVGNDFHENDYLYINQGNGTFREALTEMLRHTSRFTMGVDLADINNDGYTDIFSLDMLPEDPIILKQSLAEDGYDVFRFKLGFGYNPQFSRNTLQLNNGDDTYSEIAAQAGIHATDWSWAPLFFDMDDDGHTDLFISNGIPRRMNDIDWINFKTQDNREQVAEGGEVPDDELDYVTKMPQIKLRNKFYRNSGKLHFQDLSDGVAGAVESYSNSAVYIDLDSDGDLDIVTNNIEDNPFIYRNDLRLKEAEQGDTTGAYLQLRFNGPEGNRNAVGASVIVYGKEKRQRFENYPARGFQSSAQAPLHLGLGDSGAVDSILVVWPDRTYTRIRPDEFNSSISVTYQPNLPLYDFSGIGLSFAGAELSDEAGPLGIRHRHVENQFVDFNREPLIPHMVSTEGPALAVGDITGDGLEDFFVGSAKRERSVFYVQTTRGVFQRMPVPEIEKDSIFEDVDAALADLDNDGDLDLIISAGGNEYEREHEPRRQRSYLNDGSGNFQRHDVLQDVFATASKVLPQDYDGDGLVDLVVTGRVVPNAYGETPKSYLFRNTGNLTFTDVTAEVAPTLSEMGRITDAEWADLNDDGNPDLVVAIEWGYVTALMNEDGRFIPKRLSEQTGWWTSLCVVDADQDGKLDVLAGNFGTNNKLQPDAQHPVRLRVNDFDGNGRQETVLTYFVGDRELPFANYAELVKQLPGLKKKYIYARDFARADPAELFGPSWEDAETLEIQSMVSVLLRQDNYGEFTSEPLPERLQWSSIHAIQQLPDQDDGTRFLVGGNFLNANIEMGWYDAGRLAVLTINRAGEMQVAYPEGAAFGQVRNMEAIELGDTERAYLVAFNNDSLRLYRDSVK